MTTHLPTVDAAPTAPSTARSRRGYVVAGLAAGAASAALVYGLAAAAKASGVTFEVPAGGESIPMLAFPQMVVFATILGLVLAACLKRWAARPARTFVVVTVALTAVSLVPPFAMGSDVGTAVSLVALHLVAAAIVIPVIAARIDR